MAASIIADIAATIAERKSLAAQRRVLVAEIREEVRRSEQLVAASWQTLARCSPETTWPDIAVRRKHEQGAKQNKLFHKNRGLASNIVVQLRPAGVDCDIVVPNEIGFFPTSGPISVEERRELVRLSCGFEEPERQYGEEPADNTTLRKRRKIH